MTMLPTFTRARTALRCRPLKTQQTTCYAVGDAGDYEKGETPLYTVYSSGAQDGTTNVDVAHYAAATISFTASTKTIADSANGLATVLTGDTIVIKGSASNDGVYTVASGGVAGSFTVSEALVDEGAGATVKIYKRASISNNTVLEAKTGLEWLRNTTSALKIGAASDGNLVWRNTALDFVLHSAAADLQMIATNTLRIVGGAGELGRYHVGDVIVCAGFANAVNNLPAYPITNVAVNGSDLDITLQVNNNVLVSEEAAGSRSIALVCRHIWTYCAAANAAGLGGYTDWWIPNDVAMVGLRNMEATNALPDATAFPGWPAACYVWSGTTIPSATANSTMCNYFSGGLASAAKTTAYFALLVRRSF